MSESGKSKIPAEKQPITWNSFYEDDDYDDEYIDPYSDECIDIYSNPDNWY